MSDDDSRPSVDEEEIAAKGKKSSKAPSEDDPKDTQDITNVALERTIFVGNLPSNLGHKDVAKLFKVCGPVESARIRNIVPEKEKLSPKVALITQRIHKKVDSVNAYVVFSKTENDEPIKKALAMNGTVIDGHHIRVDKAQQANSKRLTLTSRKKSVFVGNLRFDMRDDDLINNFERCGSVDYVRLVRDRATGLGKGFGFVKFIERAAVKKALELDGTDFKGRKLRVKKIDEKTDEPQFDKVKFNKMNRKTDGPQFDKVKFNKMNRKTDGPQFDKVKVNKMNKMKPKSILKKTDGPQFDKVKVNKMNKKKPKSIVKNKVRKEFKKG